MPDVRFKRRVRKIKDEKIVSIPMEIEGYEVGEIVSIFVSDQGLLISEDPCESAGRS